MSPLTQKGTMRAISKSKRKSSAVPQPIIEKRRFIPDPPMLPSDIEEAELTETELDDQESVAPSSTTASELDEEDEAYSDENEDDWEPPTKTPRAKQARLPVPVSPPADHIQLKGRLQAVPKSSTNHPRVSKLTKYMDDLDINENGADGPVLRKAYRRKSHESLNVDDDEEFDLPVVKKKKRSVISRVVLAFRLIPHNFIANWGRIPL